jgi:hypothetical protein
VVRPDGFVGWRAAGDSGDAAAVLGGALSALVGMKVRLKPDSTY